MKKIPNLFYNKSECSGCSACYAICPVKAITMEPDKEGFLYPIINEEICIRCYKCMCVCGNRDNISI